MSFERLSKLNKICDTTQKNQNWFLESDLLQSLALQEIILMSQYKVYTLAKEWK